MEDLSEIVEACESMSSEELAEPSLEREHAYANEDVELNEDQKDAIDSILSGE